MAAIAKKKSTEPDGELISIAEIARRCGLTPKTTADRLWDLGHVPEQENPNGPNAKLFRFTEEMLFEIKAAKDSLSAAKLRDTRAAAELKEIKVAEARGELVKMNEATEMVAKIVGAIYQEYKTRQPKRIANKLAKAKNVAEVRMVLDADTERIMKGLRENFEKFIG